MQKLIARSPFIFLLLVAACASTPPENQLQSEQAANAIQLLRSTPEEELQPTRWDQGSTTISNESRLDLFHRGLTGTRGGVYVGVGSIQNYTLAAWTKSDFIYLVDFTRIVVAINKAHIAFIKASPTADEYLQLWETTGVERARELLRNEYGNDPDYELIDKAYTETRNYFRAYVRAMNTATARYNYKIYYQDPEQFAYLRRMALADRMRAVKGNLLGDTTLRAIGETVQQVHAPVNVLYLSNAEEYSIFKPYPAALRANVLGLPAGPDAVVLRTMSVYQWTHSWAPGSDLLMDVGFHYGVQNLSDFQTCLRTGEHYVYDFFKMALDAGQTDNASGYSRLPGCPVLEPAAPSANDAG